MKISNLRLELFWNEIPIGKENAVSYDDLMISWRMKERSVRQVLHDLSSFDNGDNYILVRSASGKGFYKTDDEKTIQAYKQECLNKGKSVFSPVKKINRILRCNSEQFRIENNLRVMRENAGLTQQDVCDDMSDFDRAVDKAMLSKFENGVCIPTPYQVNALAYIYGCNADDLISVYFNV